jgi:hypothetical protein
VAQRSFTHGVAEITSMLYLMLYAENKIVFWGNPNINVHTKKNPEKLTPVHLYFRSKVQ